MDYLTIIAQAADTATTTAEAAEKTIIPIDLIWQHITSLGKIEAFTFMSFGVVCLFYGWRVFKILVAISFALIGLFLGVYLNNRVVGGDEVWLGIICMVLFAIFSVPMMRWGVCILGAAAGGILTGGVWIALGLPEQYIWAGGLIGVVAGGMLSFIVFKLAITLFTSLGGGVLIAVGILAVIYQYLGVAEKVEDLVFNQKWFLPTVLLAPTLVGIVLQNKFIKSSKNWGI